MRNPILSRFSKLSRLPSTNLECRLDSTLDTLPNTPTVSLTDSNATGHPFCSTQYAIATATANVINQNYEIFGQISGTGVDIPRMRLYYYFLPQAPGTSTNWLTPVPYTDFPLNTQVDEYTYVYQYSGNATDLALVYGMYGIDDGTEEDFYINKRVTLNLDGSFSFSVPLRRAGQYFVRMYCALYENGSREVPDNNIILTTGVKILTLGPNYGTILSSGDTNTIFAV